MREQSVAANNLAAREILHPLRDRRFSTLWAGWAISMLGDQVYLIALPWLVLQQTGSVIAMSTILMASAIPQAVLMLIGGAVTDRVSPRKIMLAATSARTLFVAGIGALVCVHAVHIWELYVSGFFFGIADAFSLPAAEKFLPSLVPAERLVTADSVIMSTVQFTEILAPAPAGAVIKTLGLAWAFFLDAISFLFVIAALWGLPDPPSQVKAAAAEKAVWQDIAEGIGYVWRDVPLRSLVLLGTVMNFCSAGLLRVGLAYLVRIKFNSPAAYGIVLSASAAGGLLGSLLAGVWHIRKRGIMILSVCVLLGVLVASILWVKSLWTTALIISAMGAAAGLANINFMAWVQQRVEIELRGRVLSVLMLSVVGLLPVSLAITGALMAWSVRFTFLLAGGIMMLVGMAAGFQKAVRQIE
jgi:MFS family permease